MTAAVLWKEYRQQRAVWLAIAILGVLVVVTLAAVMGHGIRWEVFQDRHIRSLLNAVVFCLVITYGLVSGALLLAGELDEGTMVFLDSLTGQRGTLWRVQMRCRSAVHTFPEPGDGGAGNRLGLHVMEYRSHVAAIGP